MVAAHAGFCRLENSRQTRLEKFRRSRQRFQNHSSYGRSKVSKGETKESRGLSVGKFFQNLAVVFGRVQEEESERSYTRTNRLNRSAECYGTSEHGCLHLNNRRLNI